MPDFSSVTPRHTPLSLSLVSLSLCYFLSLSLSCRSHVWKWVLQESEITHFLGSLVPLDIVSARVKCAFPLRVLDPLVAFWRNILFILWFVFCKSYSNETPASADTDRWPDKPTREPWTLPMLWPLVTVQTIGWNSALRNLSDVHSNGYVCRSSVHQGLRGVMIPLQFKCNPISHICVWGGGLLQLHRVWIMICVCMKGPSALKLFSQLIG